MFFGTPLKELKLTFLVLSPTDTSFLVIFYHFLSFFDFLDVFIIYFI